MASALSARQADHIESNLRRSSINREGPSECRSLLLRPSERLDLQISSALRKPLVRLLFQEISGSHFLWCLIARLPRDPSLGLLCVSLGSQEVPPVGWATPLQPPTPRLGEMMLSLSSSLSSSNPRGPPLHPTQGTDRSTLYLLASLLD